MVKLNLLDVPVGTGRWIPLVQKIATKYVGVDVSDSMINQAQKKIKGVKTLINLQN